MVRILDGTPGDGGVNVAAKEPITLTLVKRGVFNPTILVCVWYVLGSPYPVEALAYLTLNSQRLYIVSLSFVWQQSRPRTLDLIRICLNRWII
jgi:hypothetical protein